MPYVSRLLIEAENILVNIVDSDSVKYKDYIYNSNIEY